MIKLTDDKLVKKVKLLNKTALILIMIKLDKIDKKILLELDIDARKSYSQIAKKIGIGKNNVQYRVSKLTSKGVIKKFVLQTSIAKLGLFLSKIYLQMSGFDKKSEEELYDYLQKDDRICWIAKTEGRWDLLIGSYSESITQFVKIKNDFFAKFEKFITDYDIIFLAEGHTSQRTYLTRSKQIPQNVKDFISKGKLELTPLHIKILKQIANDARFNYTALANDLKINVKTAQKKIKELEEAGVIRGYVTFLDPKKLGYHFFKLCIYLKDYQQKKKSFIEYCLGLPNVLHVLESLGSWEIELEIETETIEEFYKLTHEIRNKHAEIIKKTESVIISDEKKLDFFPRWR